MAFIRPTLPSWTRSSNRAPRCANFLATATTKGRFERASVSRADASPFRARRASSYSCSRVSWGRPPIWRRYEERLSERAALAMLGKPPFVGFAEVIRTPGGLQRPYLDARTVFGFRGVQVAGSWTFS